MSGAKRFSVRRVGALVYKESLQVVRDPSAILVTFALPTVLMFVFAFALSLDQKTVPIGVVLESDARDAESLAAAFSATRYFEVTPARDRREVGERVVAGELRGYVLIPQDFDTRMKAGREPLVQIITDGSQPNTASFVGAYAQGVVSTWLRGRVGAAAGPALTLTPRFWFNPDTDSRNFLIPGAIAIIMTLIGTLLTALVVSREWERGTMEAIMATPASVLEIMLGKLLPYFALGLIATFGCAMLATHAFGVPMRGSYFALFSLTSCFLMPALGQGLLISTGTHSQLVASQMAALTGFLPAFMLSGFLFEISSMPHWLQLVTYLLPARYFVASLQTVFLAGDVWTLFVPNMLAMLAVGGVFFAIVALNTHKSLDNN